VKTQAEKATTFSALHEREEAFVIPNPWDVGTARLLEHLGFQALATTSAGYAFSVGRPDRSVTRSEMIAHLSEIAVSIPRQSRGPYCCEPLKAA
jgi:2-methylisocitrate lyase-like PEP mutase family enzyme